MRDKLGREFIMRKRESGQSVTERKNGAFGQNPRWRKP